jgi:hypothetical protein
MDNKLINAVIQLTSKEEKAGKFGPMAKIKDEKGLTYTVYKTKKDGTVSVAWEQLGELSVGDMVQVGYAEEIVTHPEHGTYTARTIRSFNPDIGNGVANSSAQQQSARSEAPRSSQGPSNSETFWDMKAYSECVWGYWLEGYTEGAEPLSQKEMDLVWDVFKQIEKDADKRFNPSALRQSVAKHAPKVILPDEDLPVIQHEEHLEDSIPF